MTTSYVMLSVFDLRTLEHHVYVLDELSRFYAEPASVGSDRNCDIVLDDPEVAPRLGLIVGGGHHRHFHVGAEHRRVDSREFVVGPFDLQLIDSDQLHDQGDPPPGLAVRFGPRGLGAPRPGPPNTWRQPHVGEQRRLLGAFRATAQRIAAFDVRWCEDRVRVHLDALSRATAPRSPLVPGWIEYASSVEDAFARWNAAWSLAEAGPFVPSAWAYVHRFALWMTRLQHAERLTILEHALSRPEVALDPIIVERLILLLLAHLKTLEDPASPVKPLLELAERGVFAFALPDTGVLLLAPSAVDPPVDLAATALSDVRDPQQRTVFADLLEQRGQLLRAARIRQNKTADDRPRIDRIDSLFYGAAPLLMEHRAHGMPKAAPILHEATGEPPAEIYLEHAGVAHALAAVSSLAIRDGELLIGKYDAGARVGAILTFADSVLWIRPFEYVRPRINGYTGYGATDIPLYDGDVLEFEQRRIVVHIG